MSSFLERLAAQVLDPGGVRPRLPSRYERAPATLTLIAADAEVTAVDGRAPQPDLEQPDPAGPVSQAGQRLTAEAPGRDRHQGALPDVPRKAQDSAEPATQPEERVSERLAGARAAAPFAPPPPGASSSFQQEDARPARADLLRETSPDKEAPVYTGPVAAPAADPSEAALPGQNGIQPEPAIAAPGEIGITQTPVMAPSRVPTGERGSPEEHLTEAGPLAGPAIPVPLLDSPARVSVEAGEIPGQGASAGSGRPHAPAVAVTRLTEDAMPVTRLVTGRTADQAAPVNGVERVSGETLAPAQEHISRRGPGTAPEPGLERAAEPGIYVTIGSVEVRSPAPPPPPVARGRPGPPLMTLDDYLARRREGDQ